MSIISSNLKKARKTLGWSQEEAAAILSIKRSRLASYEEARAEPSIGLLPRIVQAYGIGDWQRFISDPEFDLAKQDAPKPIPSIMEQRYNELDPTHKKLVKTLLNLP